MFAHGSILDWKEVVENRRTTWVLPNNLVLSRQMAYASLKNAVTEATDPKGNTFCWNTFGPLVSGQKTAK